MRKFLCPLVLLLALPAVSLAQSVAVSDALTIPANAGEAQSTVVPPGKKPQQCNEGRFLVTDDATRPPSGVVFGRDLDKTGSPYVQSKFDMGALAANFSNDISKSNYFFGTNDHDLVTLSNGDVLYITGAFTRMPMYPQGRRVSPSPLPVQLKEPAWFKDTYRDVCFNYDAGGACTNSYPFGPNARSTVLVFRSEDCGENFTFVSEMDPVHFGGGKCALPQFRRRSDGSAVTAAPWDMGGTDGQFARVDPADDRVYLVFQCVGYYPVSQTSADFVLDEKNKVNKTLVLESGTGGASWSALGYIDQAAWRFGVVPLAGDELAFGFASSVLTATKSASGAKYTFDSTGVAAPAGKWNWMGWWNFKDTSVPLTQKNGNVFGSPVIAREPGAKSVLLAFPDTFGASGYGYRVFHYDCANKTLAEDTPIKPVSGGKSSIAFHLVAADPGSGPVLLYWSDLDASTNKITERGRLLTGVGESSEDFVVSRAAGADYSFALTDSKWFGDYYTAGAYAHKTGAVEGQGRFRIDMRTTRFDFYPVWVEPDNKVHYARVEYAVEPALLTASPQIKPRQVKVSRLTPDRWRPQPPPVELRYIQRPGREMTSEPDVRHTTPEPRPLRPIRPARPADDDRRRPPR